MAAVAGVVCTTRVPDADAGARIEFRHGACVGQRHEGCPQGTSIQVSDLFGDLPARRNFLRSAPAEAARIQEVVTRYALAHPEVRFALAVDGKEAINTPGSGRLQDVILSIYGAEVAGRMLPVSLVDGEVSVDGYTGSPDLNRRNRSYTTLLVNRRWVYDRSIYYAIEQAYQGTLPDRRFPFAVINISVAARTGGRQLPSCTKREVRFRNGDRLFSLVRRAVRDALIAHAPPRTATRSFAPVDAAPQPTATPASLETPRLPSTGEPSPRRDGIALPTTALASPGGSLRDVLADLRVVGQISQTYIVAEGRSGMYLIDQHAAHERVVFDQIRQRIRGDERPSQPLLAPLAAELSATQTGDPGKLLRTSSRTTGLCWNLSETGLGWSVRSPPSWLPVPTLIQRPQFAICSMR